MKVLVSATVARGRSIIVNGRTCVPGESVRLTPEDITTLLPSGFLEDPDGRLAAAYGPPPAPTLAPPKGLTKPNLVDLKEANPNYIGMVSGGYNDLVVRPFQ